MSQAASFLPLSAFPTGIGALARAMSPYQFNPFDLNPRCDAGWKGSRLRCVCHDSLVRLLILRRRGSPTVRRAFSQRGSERGRSSGFPPACP